MWRRSWLMACAVTASFCCIATARAADCDAACLAKLRDQYLSALTGRKPQILQLGPDVRFTENGAVLKPGEGLWQGASSLGEYRQYFVDPVSQQAMFIGVVKEGDRPAIVALRLGMSAGRIREIEHIVARKGSHPLFAPEAFVTPHPSLSAVVAPAARVDRQRMIEIADSYFQGIERHDSKVILASDDCQRVENGVQTTNQPGRGSRNCAHSADLLTYIRAVKDRRYPIVDTEHGIVVSIIEFDIPGEPDRQPVREPRTLLLAEWFKIDGGRIQHIEAVMHNLPHGTKSGWER